MTELSSTPILESREMKDHKNKLKGGPVSITLGLVFHHWNSPLGLLPEARGSYLETAASLSKLRTWIANQVD